MPDETYIIILLELFAIAFINKFIADE